MLRERGGLGGSGIGWKCVVEHPLSLGCGPRPLSQGADGGPCQEMNEGARRIGRRAKDAGKS
jgi:hypothetical protein